MDRYTGKPFLKLLDCYVLNAIDELDDGNRSILVQMEPKLAAVYSTEGTWLDIVQDQMDLPQSFPETIRDFWGRYKEHAMQQGVAAIPIEFAMSFVDQNLS